MGYSPWGLKESDMNGATEHAHIYKSQWELNFN